MKRKQLKRGVKGWRMLPNSRSVARPSRWGNPYIAQTPRKATKLFRTYAIKRLKREPDWLDPLRGLNYLYCWCEEDAPWCHADVLIELLER